jgi:hypothetical protein
MAHPHRVSGKFEFSNGGTLFSFDPNKPVYDNLKDGKKITWLELHLELVRIANRPDVFVINNRGEIVNPDGSYIPYYKVRELPRKESRGENRRRR